MKNVLTKEDITQVRGIVREEIANSELAAKFADFSVKQDDMGKKLEETSKDSKKILSILDAFVKKNEKLEQEQTIHCGKLTQHKAWFDQIGDKTGLKFEY